MFIIHTVIMLYFCKTDEGGGYGSPSDFYLEASSVGSVAIIANKSIFSWAQVPNAVEYDQPELYCAEIGATDHDGSRERFFILATDKQGAINLRNMVSLGQDADISKEIVAEYSQSGVIIVSEASNGEITSFLAQSAPVFQASYGPKICDIPVVACKEARFAKPAKSKAARLWQAVLHNQPYDETLDVGEPITHLDSPVSDWEKNAEYIVESCNRPDIISKPREDSPEVHLALFDRAHERATKRGFSGEYLDQLRYELDVMSQLKVSGYVLQVSDLVDYCHNNNITVGPGRGSAAGSLVCYTLGITEIDPIKYGLSFDRWLSKDRVGVADIDLDVSSNDRNALLQHITESKTKDHVARLSVPHLLRPAGAFQAACRVLSPSEETVREAKRYVSDDAVGYGGDKDVKFVLSASQALVDHTRSIGVHPCAVVITPEPIDHYSASWQPPDGGMLAIQLSGKDAENIGLTKLDILSSRVLQQMTDSIKLARFMDESPPGLSDIPDNDAMTSDALLHNQVNGIFQLGSRLARTVIAQVKPTSISELAVVEALGRPGPLKGGLVEKFVNKKGLPWPPKLKEIVAPMVADTSGIPIFQEQIGAIAKAVAGLSEQESRQLIHACAKKDKNEMNAIREKFDSPEAARVFDLIAPFAGYAFNKAHAISYATISWRSIYLREHHPQAWLETRLSHEGRVSSVLAEVQQDADRLGVSIPSLSSNDNQLEQQELKTQVQEKTKPDTQRAVVPGIGKLPKPAVQNPSDALTEWNLVFASPASQR